MNTMRKFFKSVFAVALAMALSSCGKAYYDIIPESSPAVASLDFAQIAAETESGLNGMKNVLPFTSGIDLTQPAYAFVSPGGYYGVVVAVDDEKDVLDAVSASKEFSQRDNSSGLHWAVWKSNWQMAWNGGALLVIGPVVAGEQSFMRRTVSAMFKSGGGIGGSDLFGRLEKMPGGAKLVARLSSLPSVLRTMLSLQVLGEADADSVLLESSCSFGAGGKIVMKNELTAADGGELPKPSGLKPYRGGMDGERLTGGSMAYAFMGIDGRKLAERLRADRSAKGFWAAMNVVADFGKIIGGIDGDALLSLDGIDGKGGMNFSLVAEIKDASFLDGISQWKKDNPQGKPERTSDGGYKCSLNGKSFEFGVRKDGRLLCRYGAKAGGKAAEGVPLVFPHDTKGRLCYAKAFPRSIAHTPFVEGLFGGKLHGLLNKYATVVYSAHDAWRSEIVLEPIKHPK